MSNNKTPKCPSCDVAFENHLGLIGTCANLQEFLNSIHPKELNDLAEAMSKQLVYDYMDPYIGHLDLEEEQDKMSFDIYSHLLKYFKIEIKQK